MEEKTLLRMRHLRDKREKGTLTDAEKEELNELEAGLTKSLVCRDLSEEYTISEMRSVFD